MAVTDTIVAIFCLFVSLNSKITVSANEHCFTFKGNSYLKFSLGGHFDNSNSAHFEIDFRTASPDGVLMYSRGASGDLEALYIREGNLHYHLFNTGRGGVGRQFGGHFVSDEPVNTNEWIKVHVYRSYQVAGISAHATHPVWKTGFEFELDGTQRSYTDGEQRHELHLSNDIYFGGYLERLSDTVGNFTGQMRRIWEHTNVYPFEYPSLNYKSQVEFHCIGFSQPQ